MAEHAAQLARRAGEVAVCLDFDGTIAPIVEDPAAARPLAGITELLGPLAERYAAVALVSGRPATYLASHAAAPGVRYLGLYGLEEIVDGRVHVDPRLAAARPAVEAAARDLAADPAVAASGAHLEDKRYAVAVHTRRVADPERWAEPIGQAAARVAARHDLEVVPGTDGVGAAPAGAQRQGRRRPPGRRRVGRQRPGRGRRRPRRPARLRRRGRAGRRAAGRGPLGRGPAGAGGRRRPGPWTARRASGSSSSTCSS